MTFLININDRGYYMRDAYYLQHIGTTRGQLGQRQVGVHVENRRTNRFKKWFLYITSNTTIYAKCEVKLSMNYSLVITISY